MKRFIILARKLKNARIFFRFSVLEGFSGQKKKEKENISQVYVVRNTLYVARCYVSDVFLFALEDPCFFC